MWTWIYVNVKPKFIKAYLGRFTHPLQTVVNNIQLILIPFLIPRSSLLSASLPAPPPTHCLPSLTPTLWWPVTWWTVETPSWLWPETSTWSSALSGGQSGAPCVCWLSCTTRARTASSTHATSVNTMWRRASTAPFVRWEFAEILLFLFNRARNQTGRQWSCEY